MSGSTQLTRRKFLVSSAAASVATLASGNYAQAAMFQDAVTDMPAEMKNGGSRERIPLVLQPFPMAQVRLLPGEFLLAAETNRTYLESLPTDRLLYSFQKTAGLPTTGQPLGGWEKPDCEVRGHFSGGHYLSACALTYASMRDESLKKNADSMVGELKRCQRKNGNGYLSAFPEEFFNKLSSDIPVWAPFYTVHKIMAGMLDMYVHTGNEDALHIAEGMAQWTGHWMSGISDMHMARILRTEYGGMQEVLCNLYAVSGKQEYLDISHRFEQASFFDPLAQHRDELQGLHANTHVPKVIGAARRYELTGDVRYRNIADYFWSEVVAERTYCIGGTSNREDWLTPPGDLRGDFSFTNAECCVSYNMMKLTRHLASWTGDPHYMDYYERVLYNARLGTQNANGLKMYYYPLAAGYWKFHNSPTDSFWCCTGTGAEEFSKFNDSIYFRDANGIYVNLFIPSEVSWPERGIVLRQETAFPKEQTTTLRIQTKRPVQCVVNVRIPHWTSEGGFVRLNGRKLEIFARPGSYLTVTRTWVDGDQLEVSLPMSLHTSPLQGDPTMQAMMYGPLVLAADQGSAADLPESMKIGGYDSEPKGLPAAANAPKVKASSLQSADWVEAVSVRDLTFRTANQSTSTNLMPVSAVTDQKYAVYWKVTA